MIPHITLKQTRCCTSNTKHTSKTVRQLLFFYFLEEERKEDFDVDVITFLFLVNKQFEAQAAEENKVATIKHLAPRCRHAIQNYNHVCMWSKVEQRNEVLTQSWLHCFWFFF